MCSEQLHQSDFESREFTVHQNTSQIQLYSVPNIHICSINSRRPPQHEPPIGYLVQTTPLSISKLLVFHGLFESCLFFPKKTFPVLEKSRLEQSMLQNALYSAQRLYYVSPILF